MSVAYDLHLAHKKRLKKMWEAGISPPTEPKVPPKINIPAPKPSKRPVQTIDITDSDADERIVIRTFTDDWRPLIRDVRIAVCEYFSVTPEELDCKQKLIPIVHRRFVAMHLCARLTGRSFPEIGRKFGGYDHTSVMHANRKISDQRAANPALDEELNALEEIIMRQPC